MLQTCIALVQRPDHRHSILSMTKHIEGSSRRISQNPSYARSTGSGYIGSKGKACINIGNSIYRQKTVESYAYNIWWRLKTFRERSGSDMLQKRRYACLDLFVDVLVRVVDVVDLDHGLVPHIDSGSYREEANTGKEEQHSTWHRCNAHTRMMT